MCIVGEKKYQTHTSSTYTYVYPYMYLVHIYIRYLFFQKRFVKDIARDLRALREGIPYHFFCFFIKFIKGGGGSFPFIKNYDVNFVYSGGLWQHEIGIEKVF